MAGVLNRIQSDRRSMETVIRKIMVFDFVITHGPDMEKAYKVDDPIFCKELCKYLKTYD